MSASCEALLASLTTPQKDAFRVIIVVVAVVAAFLNLVAIGLFVKVKSLRTFSNALLMSLLISDILAGSVLSPIPIVRLSISDSKHNCLLNAISALVVITLTSSGATVGAIAYDRYQHITRGSTYSQYMNSRRKLALIAFPWLLALLIIPARQTSENIFTWILFSVYVVCYTLLVGSYLRLFQALDGRLGEASCCDGNKTGKYARQAIMRRNKKVARFIVIIIFTFIVCTLGTLVFRILRTVHIYRKDGLEFFKDHGALVHAIGRVLFQLNAVLNPIIYFEKHHEFKKALFRILRKRSSSVSP